MGLLNRYLILMINSILFPKLSAQQQEHGIAIGAAERVARRISHAAGVVIPSPAATEDAKAEKAMDNNQDAQQEESQNHRKECTTLTWLFHVFAFDETLKLVKSDTLTKVEANKFPRSQFSKWERQNLAASNTASSPVHKSPRMYAWDKSSMQWDVGSRSIPSRTAWHELCIQVSNPNPFLLGLSIA